MSVGLIDFLRGWGESLFTSKKAYIAQQSLPNAQESVITVPNESTEYTTVSPIDGWACMISNDGNLGNFQLFTNEIHSVISVPTPFWFRGFIPVKKGDTVNYRCSGSGSTGGKLSFIRSIGEGLNQILQSGGALCLRLKTIFNRCSSSPAVRLSLPWKRLFSVHQRITLTLRIQRLVTDTSLLRYTMQNHAPAFRYSMKAPKAFGFAQVKSILTIGETICLLEKAKRLTFFYVIQAQAALSSISFPRPARLSFAQGGAL